MPAMNIGIIGLGVVGSALKFGFSKLGHNIIEHDIKLQTKTEDLLKADIVYICVPTPPRNDGGCDSSIVWSCIEDLITLGYEKGIVIKSTVLPGTTSLIQVEINALCCKLRNNNVPSIAFVPEFLRERCAIYDFIENNTLLAIGCEDPELIEKIKESHGRLAKNVMVMRPIEAEFLKYYSNIFNALRIIFANEMWEMMKAVGGNYDIVKEAYLKYSGIQDIYLDVNSNFRGYGGTCLPKDVKAMAWLSSMFETDMKLFETLDKENSKFVTTVFNGMRK